MELIDSPMTGDVPLEWIVEEQDIRGFTRQTPQGPEAGYQWRLKVREAGSPAPAAWTRWAYLSAQGVEGMLAQWHWFVSNHGHQAQTPPPGQPQH